jgi:2'-5' RNA ligase
MSERLFFALWPDGVLREAIANRVSEWTAGLEGRLQRPDQWHVTLEFLGTVATERRAALQDAATRVHQRPCVIEFDRCEHWRKPQVACLVASQVPPELTELVANMRAELARAAFAPETRPFHPHVTLARNVRTARTAPVAPPLRWSATGFALVRSSSGPAGSRYEPVDWWNQVVPGG